MTHKPKTERNYVIGVDFAHQPNTVRGKIEEIVHDFSTWDQESMTDGEYLEEKLKAINRLEALINEERVKAFSEGTGFSKKVKLLKVDLKQKEEG